LFPLAGEAQVTQEEYPHRQLETADPTGATPMPTQREIKCGKSAAAARVGAVAADCRAGRCGTACRMALSQRRGSGGGADSTMEIVRVRPRRLLVSLGRAKETRRKAKHICMTRRACVVSPGGRPTLPAAAKWVKRRLRGEGFRFPSPLKNPHSLNRPSRGAAAPRLDSPPRGRAAERRRGDRACQKPWVYGSRQKENRPAMLPGGSLLFLLFLQVFFHHFQDQVGHAAPFLLRLLLQLGLKLTCDSNADLCVCFRHTKSPFV